MLTSSHNSWREGASVLENHDNAGVGVFVPHDDMRTETVLRVYTALPPDEQAIIDATAASLRAWLKSRCPGLRVGTEVCLEIIAAVGQKLAENEPRGQ